jgi:hypothetical protein
MAPAVLQQQTINALGLHETLNISGSALEVVLLRGGAGCDEAEAESRSRSPYRRKAEVTHLLLVSKLGLGTPTERSGE